MAIDVISNEQLGRKLDILIHLQLLAVAGREQPSVVAKIAVLSEMGLAPAEIGRIVAKPANYVSAVLGKKGGSARVKAAKGKTRDQA
jgi:hypothetical protein